MTASIVPFVVASWGATVTAPSTNAYIESVINDEVAPAGLPETTGANGWWASHWSSTDGEGFHGKPVPLTTTTNTDCNVLVRYTRYITNYDAKFHAPVWGAYTLDATAVANSLSGERGSKNPDFARPKTFFADPLVVTFSAHLGVPTARDKTFADAIDPRFPIDPNWPASKAKNDPAYIQRGHMVPNAAMKYMGTYEEGQVAQMESFTTANIVAQMAKCNSPSWSKLENACLDWANELGQVWLYAGPVFHDRANPTFEEHRTTHVKEFVPCPDELYYVVIGKRNGALSAIGFLMPVTPEVIDYKEHAVPVQRIQELTGLNFMPDLGEPNPAEASFDEAWLKTRPRAEGVASDD